MYIDYANCGMGAVCYPTCELLGRRGVQGQEQLASFQISSNRFEIKLVKHTTVLDNEEPLYSVC